MMEKMKYHFIKLGPRRFVIGAVLLLLILDLLNSWYLKIYWVQKNLSLLYVERLAKTQGLDFTQLSQNSILEVKQVVDNGFFFFLFIVLLNNLFFYVFYLKKKLWAQGYVLFYTVTNAILAVLFLVEGPVLGLSWFFYNIITILLYIYLYFGVKVLKFETTDAIPVHEKKEQ
jgi:hypothetical protein